MTRIVWDKAGERIFETGVSNGVLYPLKKSGVPWNGLVNVSKNSADGSSTPVYMDGIRIENSFSNDEYSGTIQAYTYPDEFALVSGESTSGHGLFYGQQEREEFGLTYKTLVGNDVEFEEFGYKLHILYNVKAKPSSKEYATISNSASPTTFSWDISVRPNYISGKKPTADLVIDSRTTDSSLLKTLEDILYGTASTPPRLPSIEELVTLFSDWPYLEIMVNKDSGINPLLYDRRHDLQGDGRAGLYTAPAETRLVETSVPGLFRIG